MDTPLPPKIQQLITERLQRGSYKNATEVIEDAFEALAERENFQALRAELDIGDQELARGEYTEYNENTLHKLAEDVKTRGIARLTEKRKHGTR